MAGLGAARVVCSHFSVIVRGSAQLFVAGPPVVAMAGMGETPDKEQLGGARMQARAGAVDNVAADEDDALAQLKRFLSYLPAERLGGAAATDAPTPPTGARRSCSRSCRASRAQPTRCGAILEAVLDAARCSSWARAFGRPTITCLARLGGRPGRACSPPTPSTTAAA